ncbi:energy transducer TonB [Pedobacter sp. PWIIR3]
MNLRSKIKKTLLLIFLPGGFISSKAQQDFQDTCTKSYDAKLKRYIYEYSSLDVQPQYPGGMEKFYALLKKGTQSIAPPEILQGTFIYSFVVDADGSIIGEEIPKKKASEYNAMEIAGLKTIRMTKWIPGICNKKNVPVRFTIPVHINWLQ